MYNRHAFRAKWHDYGEGIYFITICTHEKNHIFGRIINAAMFLSPLGEIVESCLSEISKHYPNIEIWNYVKYLVKIN